MATGPATAERPEAPLFADGLGERVVAVDAATGDLLQILRVRPQLLAVPSFEFALRERAARLANFRHAYYARVRRIDRHPTGLAIVSDHVEGVRLSEMLRVAHARGLHLDLSAALCLIRQLVPSIALLHENARDVAHGLISPERLIVTPRARLIVVEHVLGSAVEQLQFKRERLWQELRVAAPSSAGSLRFDHRADVTAIGLTALALVLGRPLADDEYPHRAATLLADASAQGAAGDHNPLPEALHSWIARALQLDVRQGFTSASDAQMALEDALAEDTGYVAAPVALETFLSRYISSLLEPAYPSENAPTGHAAYSSGGVTAGPSASSSSGPSVVPVPDAPPARPVATPAPIPVSVSAPVTVPAPPPAKPPVVPAASVPVVPVSVSVTPPPVPLASAPTPPPTPRVTVTPVAPAPVASVTPPPAPIPVARVTPLPIAPPAPVVPAASFAPIAPVAKTPSAPVPSSVVNPPSTPQPRDITELLKDFELPQQTPAASHEPEPVKAAASGGSRSGTARWRKIAVIAFAVVAVGEGGLLAARAYRKPAAPVLGTLSVQTNPPGVAVFVDGVAHGNTPAHLSLTVGPHTLELRGRGVPRSIPVSITAGSEASQYLELPETPTLGSLLVQSDPAGARVTIDGVEHGVAPVSVADLTPGEHDVTLQADGGPAVRQKVVIQAGVTASILAPVTTAAPGPVSGWVSLKAPITIELRENGRLVGTSDTDKIMMAAGRHDVELANDTLGYHATRTIQVPPGKVSPISVDLPPGTININASPWAEVFVDGKRVGETPIGNLSLPIGPHEILFKHPQLGEKRQAVSVTLSAPVRLSIDMK